MVHFAMWCSVQCGGGYNVGKSEMWCIKQCGAKCNEVKSGTWCSIQCGADCNVVQGVRSAMGCKVHCGA